MLLVSTSTIWCKVGVLPGIRPYFITQQGNRMGEVLFLYFYLKDLNKNCIMNMNNEILFKTQRKLLFKI